MIDNPGKVVTKFQFSQIFSRAWTMSMTVANITTGFKITGNYRYSSLNALSPPTSVRENLSEETGLPFLPRHNPIFRPHGKPVANDSEGFTEETSLFEKRLNTSLNQQCRGYIQRQ